MDGKCRSCKNSLTDKFLWMIFLLLGLQFILGVWWKAASLSSQMDLTELYQTPFWSWWGFSSLLLGGILVLVIFLSHTADVVQRSSKLRDKDQLTGLLNRKGLKAIYAAPNRDNQVSAKTILICDIDQFNHIRFAYGRQAADATLVQFAKMLASLASPFDLPVRISMNSFALIKSSTSVAKAQEISEFFREKIEQTSFSDCGAEQIITCTILVMKHPIYEEVGDVLTRAENAMKRIKQIKTNRVVVLHGSELIY